MRNIFFLVLFFLILILPFSSAAKVTGSFTVTGEAVEKSENSTHQESKIKEENDFFVFVKNFFKKILNFFKND